jgi:hypothetical protein
VTVSASCHCGLIRLDIAEAPVTVTDCNCSICRRYGVLWAYYSPTQVTIREGAPTDVYLWNKRINRFHRCPTCGCVTHWSAVDPARDKMGVNARLMAPEVLAQAKLRHLDGADSWTYLD